MKILNTLIASLLLSGTALGAESNPNPQYQAGGQYTAVVDVQHAQWRLMPSDGQGFAIQVDRHCGRSDAIPSGLWLLTSDAAGKPELIAPSQTVLPAGHSGHVSLISCADQQTKPQEASLAVPASLIEWLANNTGAIYVK